MLLKAFRRYSCTVVGDIYNYSNVTDEETQAQRDEGMEGSGHTARQKQSRAYSSGPQATGAVAILTSFHSESADLEIRGTLQIHDETLSTIYGDSCKWYKCSI